jgi:hypothetical protein
MTFIQRATVGLLVLNVITLVIAGVLLFWPASLPIVYNEPLPVYPEVVHKGDTLTFVMEVNKRKQYTVDVHKNIVCEDGNLVTLADARTNIPLGRQTVKPEVIIPQKASYSTCFIEITSVYEVNPLRSETQVMRTQNFKIIP